MLLHFSPVPLSVQRSAVASFVDAAAKSDTLFTLNRGIAQLPIASAHHKSPASTARHSYPPSVVMTDTGPATLSTISPASPPPRTHYGRDVSTTPAQHIPVLLHPVPTLPASSTSTPSPAVAASASSTAPNADICFFDLETTFPAKGCDAELIEYGCLLVHRTGWYETAVYGTLVRPLESRVSKRSVDCNGITEAMLASAPTFATIAPLVYSLMHGRMWCGHNVKSFDIPHIYRAFDAVKHPRPECTGVIDTLHLVRAHFRDRAGTNAMSALTQYFGLGEEKHRAVSDCRQTLEAIKGVALSLFMERELPELFPAPVVPPRVYARRQGSEVKEEAEEGEQAAVVSAVKDADDEAKEPLLSASSAAATPPSTGKRARGRPRKLPRPVSEPIASLSEAVRKLRMDGESGSTGEADEKGTVAAAQDDRKAVNRGVAMAEEDEEIEELQEEEEEDDGRQEALRHDGYMPVSTVESKEDEKSSERVAVAAAESPSSGSTSPLLSHSTDTAPPPVPPPPAISASLVALLDTAVSSPTRSFHFVYGGGNVLYHSTLRSAAGVQWERRPWMFSAEVPHVGRHVAEAGGASDRTRINFSTGKVSEVRSGSDEQQPVWLSGQD